MEREKAQQQQQHHRSGGPLSAPNAANSTFSPPALLLEIAPLPAPSIDKRVRSGAKHSLFRHRAATGHERAARGLRTTDHVYRSDAAARTRSDQSRIKVLSDGRRRDAACVIT